MSNLLKKDVYDVPHKIACLYERQLRDDELWGSFTKKCADFKKQVQLTEYSRIAPPNQRSKARYHNIDELVDWSTNQLLHFIEEKGSRVPEGKRVIGSSEIVESLFGKHKSVSEKGPKSMGRLILSMASRVGERPTEALIETAFERIKESDVNEWLRNAFC